MTVLRLLVVLFVGLLCREDLAVEPSWPGFRGPHGCGVADGQNPPVLFNKETNSLWSVAVPAGASSPIIWADRLFLTGFGDGHLLTLCYSRKDGKLLWRKELSVERLEDYHPQEGSPAASTPVTDGSRVYVYFGSCGFVCYGLDGVEQWRHSMPVAETFGGFGTGTSPILSDGLLVITRNEADGPKIQALDAATGRSVWTKAGPQLFAWCTPAVWDHDQTKELIIPVACTVQSYDLKTGAERWRIRGITSATCSTPVTGDGMLFVSSWSPLDASNMPPPFDALLEKFDKDKDGVLTASEVKGSDLERMFQVLDTNHDQRVTRLEYDATRSLLLQSKNALLAIKPGGSGDCTDTHVAWNQSKGLPYVSSPVLYRNRIYLVKDGGLASCYDAASGRPMFVQERLGAVGAFYSSPVAADGRIYAASLEGTVVVFEAGDVLNVLARNNLGERIRGTPAIVDDTLYLRTATRLCAFKSKP